jgi:hypothetical protein
LRGTHRRNETQYHLHFNMLIDGATWDIAVNIGTNDAVAGPPGAQRDAVVTGRR